MTYRKLSHYEYVMIKCEGKEAGCKMMLKVRLPGKESHSIAGLIERWASEISIYLKFMLRGHGEETEWLCFRGETPGFSRISTWFSKRQEELLFLPKRARCKQTEPIDPNCPIC